MKSIDFFLVVGYLTSSDIDSINHIRKIVLQFSHLTGSSSYPSSQFPTPLHQSKVLFIHLRHKKGIKDFASIFEVMAEEDLECVTYT